MGASDDARSVDAAREKKAGDAAHDRRSYEEAVQHYTRAAGLDPRDVDLLIRRAAAYHDMAKYEECIKDCDEAARKCAELNAGKRLLAQALARKGSALLELGGGSSRDYLRAITVLQMSLAEHECSRTRAVLDKADADMYLARNQEERPTIYQGSDGFRRGYREESSDFDQERADYYRKQGNELLKQEKYQQAAAHYTKAMEKNPNDPRVFSNRAQCHIYLGDLTKGLLDAMKCIELDHTFPKAYMHKAKVEFLRMNFDNAWSIYLEGLKCDPNNVELHDGIRRSEAFHKWVNHGIVELVPAEIKEILGESHSTNLGLQKILEAEAFKKKASDEHLKRVVCELSAAEKQKKTEESLSGVQLQLEQIKIRKDGVTLELQKANENIKRLEDQLLESRKCYNMLRSENDCLLLARDGAVREAEKLRRNRGQIGEFSPPELQRATENFSNSRKIGEGGFGSVYRGFLRNTTVAIKVLKPGNLQGQSQFEQEAAILSKVRHPHLVTLIGACSETSTLVYEFLPNGSLEDFLECAEKRRALTWQNRVRIIAEICSALIFLHQNKPHPIVHSDLKPANVLLDANLVSKLGDFGISRFLMESSNNGTALHLTMQPAGTPPYMDPEFLASRELTAQSDTYSFGILVLRLLTLTGKPPARIRQLVEDAMEKGHLTSLVDASAGEWPYALAHQLADLALRCTEPRRRSRPDLPGVVWTVLEEMMDVATPSSRPVLGENLPPSCFICPIRQEVMVDPHIAEDGHTYEAEAIRDWFHGHNTSPMTNLPLEHRTLIPNHALRSAIQEWHQQQNCS